LNFASAATSRLLGTLFATVPEKPSKDFFNNLLEPPEAARGYARAGKSEYACSAPINNP
jgi:hypothetical protein